LFVCDTKITFSEEIYSNSKQQAIQLTNKFENQTPIVQHL